MANMELVSTGNISKCQELMRTGLHGSVVTVSPRNDAGQPLTKYEAVFVGWTAGYVKFENDDLPSTVGTVNDAIVMRPNGQLEVVGIRQLKFKVEK
jgi:hypothetical protein